MTMVSTTGGKISLGILQKFPLSQKSLQNWCQGFVGFQGFLVNPEKMKIPRDYPMRKNHNFLQDFSTGKISLGISKKSQVSQKSQEFRSPGLNWDFRDFLGISQGFLGFLGFFQKYENPQGLSNGGKISLGILQKFPTSQISLPICVRDFWDSRDFR